MPQQCLKNYKILVTIILLALQIACSGDLSISVNQSQPKKATVENLDQLSANPKDEVAISGKNLTKDLEVIVNDNPVSFNFHSATKGSFIVPDDFGLGIQSIEFKLKGKSVAKFPLMNAASVKELPTLSVAPENVCNSFIYKNELGELVKGKGNCDDLISPCTKDGQTNCKAVAGLPAVSKVNVAAKILSGQFAAGVSGNAPSNSSQCSIE